MYPAALQAMICLALLVVTFLTLFTVLRLYHKTPPEILELCRMGERVGD